MPHSRLRTDVGLLVVGLGTVVASSDTAVNIAFPSITRTFALQLEDIRWVVVAYVLTYASLMLACGRLGDLVGYRRIFSAGLLLSACGLAMCSVAASYSFLLLGRVLQGTGAAFVLSCGPALAVSQVDASRRTRALAFYAAVMAIGAALGPLVGGFLMARWDWAAVFWFRIPIALLALLLSGLAIAAPRGKSVQGFDATGMMLLVAWLSTLLLALSVVRGPFAFALPCGLALFSLVSFVAFLAHETRCPQPLLQLSLFRAASFAIFNVASIAVNFAAFGVLLLVPYYLVRLRSLDLAGAGVVLGIAATGTVAGSWAAARLARRFSIERLAMAGMILTTAGLWTTSLWTATTGFAAMTLSLLLQGSGVGLFQVGYSDYVITRLPREQRGVAGSLTMVTRTMGIVLGAIGLAAIFTHVESAGAAAGAPDATAFLAGFQATFRYVAGGLAAFLLLMFLGPGLRRLTR